MRYLSILVVAAVIGCDRKPAAQPPPPPEVTVSHPAQREVIEWDEYSGHLEAPESVDLRARVNGLLVAAPFQEGGVVKKGDLLFEIDPSPFQADLDAKKAAVEQAQATLLLNQTTLSRYQQAAPGAAVAKQDIDTAIANVKQSEAQVAGAKAAVAAAQLNVDWCRVTSPINGRVSRKNITPGNLVTAGGAGQGGTLLTTVESVDPIYLYVDPDERSVLRYQRLAEEKKRVSARDARIPVFMQLLNETGFPHEGVIDFVDNRVDPGTGTLRARGVFPNPRGYLTPGFFGRMRVPGSGRYLALLVPDAAIGTDQDIRYVAVVDGAGVVHNNRVTPGALFGQLRAISEGLSKDDLVVTNGLMRTRPGIKVKATEKPIDTSSMQLTVPGSPTTQDLPATRPSAGPATGPATVPTTGPAVAPATSGSASAACGPQGRSSLLLTGVQKARVGISDLKSEISNHERAPSAGPLKVEEEAP